MKTAGVVLDFYDDLSGSVLRESFPTPDLLPDVIKVAHILSPEERDVLRDEAYALVMLNEGTALRKFACVDAGNTLLSALYFEANRESLPEEAQKIASANILAACQEFGLPIRSLEKIASPGSSKGAKRSRDPMKQPLVGDDSDWYARTNLTSVQGGNSGGQVLDSAAMSKSAAKINLESFHRLNPEADPRTTLTNDVKPPLTSTKAKNPDKLLSRPIVRDQNNFAVGRGKGDLEVNFKKVSNKVDVSGLEPALRIEKKAATNYALDNKYPLDSYADVARAIGYFEDHKQEFSPEERHRYAVKTASRAEELGIDLTPDIERYGSVDYAPDVDAHLATRRAIAPDYKEVWNSLAEKRASIEPETFASLLKEADDVSGVRWEYGGEVADPYFVTFGGNKVKEASALWSWQSRTGDYVSGRQLKKLAMRGRPLLTRMFSTDMVDAFQKDPFTIFDSLPDAQKNIIARLASQEFDAPVF